MKPKTKIIAILLALLALVSVFAEEAESPFLKKINSLLETVETEADDALTAELTSYGMRMKIASVLRQEAAIEKEGWMKERLEYYIDCIDMNNFKVLNAFRLSETIVFGNYKLNPEGGSKYKKFVYLTYDTAKKEILALRTRESSYSDLLFHVYEHGGKKVLYYMENHSSFGMGCMDINLAVLTPLGLEEICSECVYFSQDFYSEGVDDIEYQKDFEFSLDKLRLTGTDFDYDAWKYVPYEKEYRLF